jgi:two-component system, LytTR family, sensor histidine kinase LytS
MKFPDSQDNIIPKILKQRWMWHAAFWLIYFAVTLPGEIRMVMTVPDLMAKAGLKITSYEIAFAVFFLDFVMFTYTYLIVFWLYPQFFKTQRYVLFVIFGVLSALIINAVSIKISYAISPTMGGNDWWGAYLSGLSTFALFLFLITMLKFFKESLTQQQIDNQRFREAKQAELDNLKAQLSPHFLFNTMNNFYGLAVAQSTQLPDLMLRLSELMRYSLYGTNKTVVPLKDEIRYLKNYIELEKIRLEDTLKLTFIENTEGERNPNKIGKGLDNIEIAPLILIVFVENAFKHSRNIQNEAIDIKIEISVSDIGWLTFKVENNYTSVDKKDLKMGHVPASNSGAVSANDGGANEGGIGIENVKKRLEALYPAGLHDLIFEDDRHIFKVRLKIKLK